MRVHILHLGAFAHEVHAAATQLLTSEGHEVTGADVAVGRNAAPAFWPVSDLHVLVTGRPAPHLERLLDRSVVETRTPGATVLLEHPRLRLGPLVTGSGACLGCLQVRRAQHDTTYAKTLPLLQAYDADPALEPAGHLPHHVGIAAAWLGDLVTALETGAAADYSGRVSHLNLHTGTAGSDRVVGVHACPRCRATPPLHESTWLQLSTELSTVGGGHRG